MSSHWLRCPKCNAFFQPASPNKAKVPCPGCKLDCSSVLQQTSSWFVIEGKKKAGPFPYTELRRRIITGVLTPSDMALREGGKTWTPIGDIVGLRAQATVSPPQSDDTAPRVTVAETHPDGQGTAAYQPNEQPIDPAPVRKGTMPSVAGYEILGVLGRGGMGVVYKARQTKLKRVVALKMIRSGGTAGELELKRFRTEAEAVARLQHPNIVQIHDIGEYLGEPYFSLEYVAGGTLAQEMSGTPLAAAEAAQLTAKLASAIAAAHEKGVIHRDLKPANILLEIKERSSDNSAHAMETDRRGHRQTTEKGKRSSQSSNPVPRSSSAAPPSPFSVPKITDFGLAKQLDEDAGQTRTGAVMGTPSYMSPEQARGESKHIGPATDVYALGAILYETVTGRPPFRAASVLETLDQVRNQDPVSPRTLQPNLPRDVETICLKCLAKDPAKRYATAQDLADDLERFLTNQPILARPANVLERATKFVRRNVVPVSAAAAVIAALTVGLITSVVFANNSYQASLFAKKEERNAKKSLADAYFDAAVRYRHEGDHKTAIQKYRASRKAGYRKSTELLLHLAQAHAALYENEEVRKIVRQLELAPDYAKYEGSILLLKGDLELAADMNKAFALIKKAIQKGLPDAERHYALALTAESSLEAIKHLRKTIELETTHHSARALLGATLMFLGRTEESWDVAIASEALYRDDPSFQILKAMLQAIKNNPKRAHELVDKTKNSLSPKHYVALKKMVSLFESIGKLDRQPSSTRLVHLRKLWGDFAPHMQTVWPDLRNVKGGSNLGTKRILYMPPVLSKSLDEVKNALIMVVIQRGATSRKLMESALAKHPDGLLYHLYAMILLVQKDFAGAEVAFNKALDSPSMFALRRLNLSGAVSCELGSGRSDSVQGRQSRGRAIKHIEEMLEMGPLQSYEWVAVADFLIAVGEYPLARRVLGSWDRNPTEGDHLLRAQMRLEMKTGHYIAALRAAELILAGKRGDAEATSVRQRALVAVAALTKG